MLKLHSSCINVGLKDRITFAMREITPTIQKSTYRHGPGRIELRLRADHNAVGSAITARSAKASTLVLFVRSDGYKIRYLQCPDIPYQCFNTATFTSESKSKGSNGGLRMGVTP